MACLAALILALHADVVSGPAVLGMDTSTFFYPWYSYLGEQLRAGHVPGWNPHIFSGAPFAADPESGWMYLPAMAAFTFLPLDVAVRVHVLGHLLFAGLSTYALARALGANVAGSALAGIAYANSGFLAGHAVCCFAYADVTAWLPLVLLGAEVARRSTAWRRRLVGWSIAALAFSQILAAWVGQGAYYAALLLGAFVVFRNVRRPRAMLLHGATIAVFGVALGAAGLLPRLEYNLLSNLPGGYPDTGSPAWQPAWNDWGVIADWPRRMLQPGFSYPGVSTLVLALAALAFARRNRAILFCAGLTLVVLVLARDQATPLHALFGLLPSFERIHARSPERALIAFYLGTAILAGLAVTGLQRSPRRLLTRTAVAAIALLAVALDLQLAWRAQTAESHAGGGDYAFADTDLTAYYAPSSGVRFLQAAAETGQPFRYFGHAEHVLGGPIPYTLRWADPAITALEINNRALISGLDDIQGYNPIHLARYDGFMTALNGGTQNYHQSDVLPSGIESPLLDLLNVRYIILPRTLAPDQVPTKFTRPLTMVYADDTVQILERPSVLPRAWLVHQIQQVAPGQAALLLASGRVDPRTTALVEEPLAVLASLAEPTAGQVDEVRFESYSADRLVLRCTSSADSLLVLSEVYYPAWHAYVDGAPTAVFAADGALRAVPLPAGAHTVELRYESLALSIGLAISALAFLGLLSIAAVTCMGSVRARHGST